MRIGVLAVQGSFIEHRTMLENIGVTAPEVRLPDQLASLDGLIIPGGESTTIGKLCNAYNLIEPLRGFGASKPIWGTCAGAIFLSKQSHFDQTLLGLMDIEVDRNAFGRQVDSFEEDLVVDSLEDPGRPFHGIFIRAPIIRAAAGDVEILARVDPVDGKSGGIVAARQKNLLATVFHPELTDDPRFHRLFVNMAEKGTN